MCDHSARCSILRKSVSPHDLKNVGVNFLDQIEKEFENQLNHYIELVDKTYFDF